MAAVEFNLPLHPDPAYLALLADNARQARVLHFGLDSGLAADARVPLTRREPDQWARALAVLSRAEPRPAAFLLLNARFHGPRAFAPESLAGLAGVLESLAREPCFAGIVYADAYFLRALSDALPGSLHGRLQAVPSVNCGIDSVAAARSHLDLAARTRFALPERMVLDRSLNRDLNRDGERLARVAQGVRGLGLRVELLANEGCLAACPFRPAHEAVVAACHAGLDRDTFALNRDLGCLDLFAAEPWRILASPFIRPEDARHYEGLVDGLKVCGRNRGGAVFLTRAARAWLDGRWDGNLLEILDTTGEFEDRFFLANADLPEDFHARVTSCAKDCGSCAYCRDLAREHLRAGEPGPGRLDGEVRP